jgi:hypothetical protein
MRGVSRGVWRIFHGGNGRCGIVRPNSSCSSVRDDWDPKRGMRALHAEEPRGQTHPSHPKMRSETHHAGILENDDRVPDSDSLRVLEAVHMNLEFAVAQYGPLSPP